MASQGVKTVSKSASVKALEAEAAGTDITVEFRGETLHVDPEALDDYELMEQLSTGMPFMLLHALVPDGDQLNALLDTCEKNAAGRPKLSSVAEMVGELMGVVGAGK